MIFKRLILACVLFFCGITAPLLHAQIQGCSEDDYRCPEYRYSLSCAYNGTTFQSCEAFANEFQEHYTETPTTAVGLTLGLTYYRLAHLSLMAGDSSAEESFLNKSREVFSSVIANDDSSADAYSMMSILDIDSPDLSLSWRRKAVALDPGRVSISMINRQLFQIGTRDAIAEIVSIAEHFYTHATLTPKRWEGAAYAYQIMLEARRQYPNYVGEKVLNDFLSRVRRDSQWDDVMQVLESPENQADKLQHAMVTACSLSILLPGDTCLGYIEGTIETVLNDPDHPEAQVLADAAAAGMKAAPFTACIVNCVDERTPRILLLEQLVDAGLSSLPVLDAIATISLDRDKRRLTREEIVSNYPDDAQARYELGKVYYDQDYWAESIEQFEVAEKRMQGDLLHSIKEYFSQARYELENP